MNTQTSQVALNKFQQLAKRWPGRKNTKSRQPVFRPLSQVEALKVAALKGESQSIPPPASGTSRPPTEVFLLNNVER